MSTNWLAHTGAAAARLNNPAENVVINNFEIVIPITPARSLPAIPKQEAQSPDYR
jgi:hypothetical protein